LPCGVERWQSAAATPLFSVVLGNVYDGVSSDPIFTCANARKCIIKTIMCIVHGPVIGYS
jgi:hypothetical protein